MKRRILNGLILIFAAGVLFGVIFGKVGSHPVRRHTAAEVQIQMLQEDADNSREIFLQMPQVNNALFVSATKLGGGLWRFNEKRELLDPWGEPYVIGRNNGRIIITSPGLDRYNKLSSFQKWWSND